MADKQTTAERMREELNLARSAQTEAQNREVAASKLSAASAVEIDGLRLTLGADGGRAIVRATIDASSISLSIEDAARVGGWFRRHVGIAGDSKKDKQNASES